MALDPNIALSVRGPAPLAPFDPAEAMAQRSAFEVRKAQAEKMQREAAAQARIQQLGQQYGDDPDEFVRVLGREFPQEAAAFGEQLWDSRKAAAQAHHEQTKADAAKLEAGMAMLRIATPDNYGAIRGMLTKLDPNMGQFIPEQYDAPSVERLMGVGMSAKDWADRQAKSAERLISKDSMGAVAELYAGADTPEKWQNATELAGQAGLGKLAAQFGPMLTPEGRAQAQRMAIGSKGAAELELKAVDDARMAQAAAETGRHNAAMEGNARAALGVSQGHLRVAQGNLQRQIAADAKPGAAGSGKPPTVPERAALGFFNRAKQASDDLDLIEQQVAGMGLGEQARLKFAPNILQSQTGQSYDQAQRAFTEARLRKDSGAAIPEGEFENDRRTYFAQPGDKPSTLEQKRRARMTILASLAAQSGRALGEFYGDEAEGLVQSYREKAKRGTAPSPAAGKQAKAANPLGIR